MLGYCPVCLEVMLAVDILIYIMYIAVTGLIVVATAHVAKVALDRKLHLPGFSYYLQYRWASQQMYKSTRTVFRNYWSKKCFVEILGPKNRKWKLMLVAGLVHVSVLSMYEYPAVITAYSSLKT